MPETYYYWWETHQGSGRPSQPRITAENPYLDPMLGYNGNFVVVTTADTPDDDEAMTLLDEAVIEDSDGWLVWS